MSRYSGYGYRHKRNSNALYSNYDFEITKREVLFSIAIVAVMLLIGFMIHGKISNDLMLKNQKYDTALQIEQDSSEFDYGMRTDIGYAFVYGKLQAVDTVTYSEIGGQYMYVEKVKEKYTQHTRTVTYTTGSGKTRQTHTRVETYWTWDRVGSEDKKCKEVSFLDTVFDSNKIHLPESDYIDTIKESSHIRYKYYGVGIEHIGTIFAELKDNTIPNNTSFYKNMTIEETLDYLESGYELIIFWVIWIVLIAGLVFGFYYIDNKWLEG